MGFVRTIDRLSEVVGKTAAWLGLAMVLLAALNALLGRVELFVDRRLSYVALDEAEWYLFSLMFLFAAPWALRDGAHVRVDVLYGRLGPRGRAWTDLLGGLILGVPFAIYAVWATVPAAAESLHLGEVSNDAGGLLRWPLKMAIPVAFGLLALQGIANSVRAFAVIRSGKAQIPSGDNRA